MLTSSDFFHLKFLEGRWEGTGPDGKPFYEEYSFSSESQMESSRFADSSFREVKDGSSVTLKEGRITSQWNEFTWSASTISPGKACFEPINAPSSFCWESTSDSTVEVTQRWKDESGTEQKYVVPMRRL
ncbi:hypothetical protein [Shewanella sp. OMA3-2]|uniref:hypothetical protein n=1 Tax=Shewanella sp. OMA3-2 TaxID=2908650 RepID=UPI001F2D500A|nr:hypothetical protein [Shewanella sp. OMA3-2]UJF23236.1 hypothetical protein L0B17_07920 [Shewanella sp. OMA3-2]